MSGRTVKVVLEFSEVALNRILGFTFVGDAPPAVADMSEEQFKQFQEIMQESAGGFVEEIVEGSGDDGDWLYNFMEQFE